MYYIVYETKNLLDGKMYRGTHMCSNLDDGYLGSSDTIKAAIRRYGRKNFVRRILEFCDSREHAYEREAHWVTLEWANREDTYNLRAGGEGGAMSDKARKRLSLGHRGLVQTPEANAKRSEKLKGRVSPNKGKFKNCNSD